MTQALRWYPMLALGSFVAEAEGGTLLVAPMNADGTRSTFDGEIVGLDDDTRATDPALDAQTRRFLLVGKLADAFRSVLRRDLTEAELLEVDRLNEAETNAGVCHSHDFCDANMAMAEAFAQVFGRAVNVQAEEDTTFWGDAWNLAVADGFSTWKPTDADFAMLERIASAAELGVAEESDAKTLRLFADRIRAGILEVAPADG